MEFLDLNGKPIHPDVLGGGTSAELPASPKGMQFLDTPYKASPMENVKNAGEGLVNYAGGLPKGIADSGILDKPAAAIAKGTANVLRFFGAPVASKEKVDANLAQTKFSDTTKGSQVGGDPTSALSKNVSSVLNTAEMIGGIGAAGAGVARSIAKKEAAQLAAKAAAGDLAKSDVVGGKGLLGEQKMLANKGKQVLGIISESDNLANKRAALTRGGIDETQSAISRWWNGTKKVVQPSQRSINSAGTVISEIPNASNKPQKLYTQIVDKVSQIAGDLSPKLKTIEAGDTTAAKNAIRTLVTESKGQLGPTVEKSLSNTLKTLSTTNNLDEVWSAAKELDAGIPDKIKAGIDLTAREEGIYKAWRAARSALNDFMDTAAKSVGDVEVKQQFKKMSNLYHAIGQITQNIGSLTKSTGGAKASILKAARNLGVPAAIGYGANRISNAVSKK